MLNVLCDHRPLTRLNSTPCFLSRMTTTTTTTITRLSPFSRSSLIFSRGAAEDVLSNSRLIAGSSGGRGQGSAKRRESGVEKMGCRRGNTRVPFRGRLVLADNKLATLASRCFIAPRRELESRSFHEGRISFDSILGSGC